MGDVELPTDRQRLRQIKSLATRFADHLIISQDICTKTRLVKWGGHGYGHLFRNVVPLMQSMGFDGDLMHKLTTGNPRRLLTLEEPDT